MQTYIYKNKRCKKCKWPVVFALCNDEMACDWDYWNYCSNKGCENHVGEGIFQNTPDGIFRNTPDWIEFEEPK